METEPLWLLRKLAREDYAWYLASNHWKALRDRAFDHHGRACSRCRTTTNLQVHHLTYRRLGCERVEDLQVLCRGCHERNHPRQIDRTRRTAKARALSAVEDAPSRDTDPDEAQRWWEHQTREWDDNVFSASDPPQLRERKRPWL
jgi:5-methylcytosine-specific restriction endonuclease McrA